MLLNHILVAVCWIMYGFVHSLLASLQVKYLFKKRLGNKYRHYRLAYNLFAVISLAAIIGFQFSIHSKDVFSATTITKTAGGFFAFSGFGLMLICIRKYFAGLSGLRSLVQEQVYSELIISGVHRYVRHPLYLGTFSFIWGLFLLLPTYSFLVTDVVITGYTLAGINLEEKKLVAEFGGSYKDYQKKVPKLLPKFSVSGKLLHHHRQKNSIER